MPFENYIRIPKTRNYEGDILLESYRIPSGQFRINDIPLETFTAPKHVGGEESMVF